jgi:hypothetical protein
MLCAFRLALFCMSSTCCLHNFAIQSYTQEVLKDTCKLRIVIVPLRNLTVVQRILLSKPGIFLYVSFHTQNKSKAINDLGESYTEETICMKQVS